MSAGGGRYDDRGKGYLFLLMLTMTILSWFAGVHAIYTIPPELRMKAYYFALLATPEEYRLWILPFIGCVTGFVIMIVVNNYMRTGFEGANYVFKLRGPDMVSPAALKDRTKESVPQITIGGIPIPIEVERKHTSVGGSTGAGKTQVIAEYIDGAVKRGDRIICIDPNGGFMESFWKEGDIILNPFDQRGSSWSIFNEIRTAYDVEQFAVSIIPRSASTEQETWNSMARTIVSEVMLKLARTNRGTTEELIQWLTIKSNEELQGMLADTSAAGVFHGATETLGSIRTVLTQYITPHKFLADPVEGEIPFSIRDWLAQPNGNLWVTWREDMLQSLKPLISCWVDVICAASLSTVANGTRVTQLVIDELDSLEKLNYLIPAATKGRKHELSILAGFQSYAQLDKTNGEKDALTLRNSLSTSVSLMISEMDTLTAEEMSKGLGQHEVVRTKKSLSIGGGGNSSRGSTAQESVTERLVMPSQIHNLAPLTGFLKFSGNYPIAKIRLVYRKRPSVVSPLELIVSKWTTAFSEQQGAAMRQLDDFDADAIVADPVSAPAPPIAPVDDSQYVSLMTRPVGGVQKRTVQTSESAS